MCAQEPCTGSLVLVPRKALVIDAIDAAPRSRRVAFFLTSYLPNLEKMASMSADMDYTNKAQAIQSAFRLLLQTCLPPAPPSVNE